MLDGQAQGPEHSRNSVHPKVCATLARVPTVVFPPLPSLPVHLMALATALVTGGLTYSAASAGLEPLWGQKAGSTPSGPHTAQNQIIEGDE